MIKLTKEEQAVADRLLEIAAGVDRHDSCGMNTESALEHYRKFIQVVKTRVELWGEAE